MRFEDLDFSDEVLDALDAMNFGECTPVQEKAIPEILDGNDLIAVAQTGTGKTAAFLLPVIQRMQDDGTAGNPGIKCLVLTPTRELAMQIDHQLEGFSYYLDVSNIAIYGSTDGPAYARQQRGLKEGADIVVATPGRLMAHINMGYVDFSKLGYLILDEADRMLDMGFYDDIMHIASRLPSERQTLLFSATMPERIVKLAGSILHDPVQVKIAVSRPADKIDQRAIFCGVGEKPAMLESLLGEEGGRKRVIVFVGSKLGVKDLRKILTKAGFKAGEMHSDLEQSRREEVIRAFKAGHTDILVATDIMARGIDIDDISMVVNYDVPAEPEDYVHRIGRTARAGEEGIAVTFVSERDRRRFARIEKFLGKRLTRVGGTDGKSAAPATERQQPKDKPQGINRRKPVSRGLKPSPRPAAETKIETVPAVEVPVSAAKPQAASETSPEASAKKKRRPFWKRRRKPSSETGTPA